MKQFLNGYFSHEQIDFHIRALFQLIAFAVNIKRIDTSLEFYTTNFNTTGEFRIALRNRKLYMSEFHFFWIFA